MAVTAAFAMARADDAAAVRIVVLGDSLVAGYGLAPEQSFPARLQARLRQQGHKVDVVNAGVSGDTTASGLARLDWAVPDDTDGVIVELGANDALRGIDPAVTEKNLDRIITRLRARNLPVLLAGMMAPPNLGAAYSTRFNAIFASLAAKHEIALYPFFLEGVAAMPDFNQDDGIHPNERGVAVMVDNFEPHAARFLQTIRP